MKFFLKLLTLCVAFFFSQELSPPIRDDRPPPIIRPPPRPQPDLPQRGPIPKSKFTVITPNTIRRGKSFNVYVRGFELRAQITIKLTLASNDNTYKIDNDVILSREVSRKTVRFDTSILPAGKTDFQFTVSSGNYTETKNLIYIAKQNSMFIQTNKAIFRPGDLIQFRIFSIDSEANAFNPTEPVTVVLSDPRNNEIYKADNLTFTNGKYEGKFKLSSSPILGTWKLQVQYNDEEDNVFKWLTVTEYVLPLFSASLIVPSRVSTASGKFPITINAEYTFGEAVNGIATLTFTRFDNPGTFTKNITLTASTNTFEIDIRNDLDYTLNEVTDFTVTLDFIDPLSNTKATDRKTFSLVPYTYSMDFIGESYFRADTNYNYKIAVKKLDGTPAPRGTKVTITVRTQMITYDSSPPNVTTTTLTTGSDGFASGQLKTSSLIASFEISVSYQGYTSYVMNVINFEQELPREREFIYLSILTPNPCFNEEIKIQARVGTDNVDSLIYFVTSKGVLLESSRVYFDYNEDDMLPTTVNFSIYPDFSYAPTFRIYAYYLSKRNWTFITTSIKVGLQQKLPNYLTLSLAGDDANGNVIVKPSNEISLAIETNKYSTVSLYAVDQRILLLNSGQNFTLNQVLESFYQYEPSNPYRFKPYYDAYGATPAHLNFYTNIPLIPRPNYPIPMEQPRAEPSIKSREGQRNDIQVRKNFLETFLWRDVKVYSSLSGNDYDYYDNYDNRGREVIKAKVPDSITTYVIYGISMSKYDGMGLPESLPTATVFLPFFISMELPYSIKRHEILIQDIIIFNYLKKSQKATVTITGDPKFKFVDADKYGWTVKDDSFVQQINSKNGNVRLTMAIRPVIVGFVNVKVSVRGPLAGDAIEKPLKVIHEGIPRSITSSVLLAIDKASNAADKNLKCTLPTSAYDDYVEVSSTVVGDILGKALNNLEKLIVMPGGCGEQTLIGFVPDVVIYRYLKATNQLTEALKSKLTQYLLAGYQNQLQYQRNDGGFSAFGENDPASSTWLTAYTAWSFYSAKDYININPTIIQNALNFIMDQANTDGSFNEPGLVIHSDMQGAAGNGIALTAYVTIVLSTLVNDYPAVKPKRDAAVQYLISKLNSVTDVYELGVIANALQLSGSKQQASVAFIRFYALKTETTTEMFWRKSGNQNNGVNSLDIEITAYGLRILVMRNGNLANVIKVVKYLISQSNSFGGYTSTQDTVMALLALSDFASTYTLTRTNLNLELTPSAGKKFNVMVDSSNALTLQSFSLDDQTRSLNVHPTGTGIAIVSLTCNFYDDPSKTVPSFGVEVKFSFTCRYRSEIEICAKSLTGSSSNMAIMEVRMPSGFMYQSAWWRTQNSEVSKIETFESDTIVVFYLNSISTKGTCVTFNAYRSGEVAELKPGTVEINDYYDTSKVGSAPFSIPNEDLNNKCFPFYE